MHSDSLTEMRPPIAIDASHLGRLSALSSLTSGPMVDVCEYLREELDRAHVLPAEKLRPDIVNMGSQVEFRDEQTGKIQKIIMVYPFDADIARRRVSILTQVGAALLGLSVNQTPYRNRRTSRADRAQGPPRDLAVRHDIMSAVITHTHLSYSSATDERMATTVSLRGWRLVVPIETLRVPDPARPPRWLAGPCTAHVRFVPRGHSGGVRV